MKISNFKVQTSNKLQSSNFKFWCLMFGSSLVFDVWFLIFEPTNGGV